ncbi:hypothetical protein C8J57DRAFT_1248025 [Mycena rebaudengoi]|nr:hypothetical protein C8J57DRAFT_1248025 [Mycena rebaudengoi]
MLIPIAPSDPSVADASTLPHILGASSSSRPFPQINPKEHKKAINALYHITLPSPLCGTASRRALVEENTRLQKIAFDAGIELEQNYTRLVLMDHENERLQQQIFAKKKIKSLKPKFKVIKKELQASSAVFLGARSGQGHGGGWGCGGDSGHRGGHGRGCPRGVQSHAGGQGRGRGHERAQSPDFATGSDTDASNFSQSRSPSSSPSPTLGPSTRLICCFSTSPAPGDDSDEDDKSEETCIVTINGHRWVGPRGRQNVKFQVLWNDHDVTWESLATVNDCE